MANMKRLRDINRRFGGILTSEELADYAESIDNGYIDYKAVAGAAKGKQDTRKRNREQYRLVATNLGMPTEYVDQFVDSWTKYGDAETALIEVRQSPTYDKYFPGNRREDGSVRYTEQQYQQVVESYAATLEDYGVNPDLYESKFGELIAGDVAPDEFVGRVQAINDRIINAPEEVRIAFANEFGIPEATNPATILGIALAPDIGEQVRDRRISIAQVTGQATRFGFSRSRQRVETLLNAGLDANQAAQFYSGAVPTVNRLAASAGLTGETFGIGELEDAAIGGDNNALSTASRLAAQDASRFSRQGSVQADRSGALTGLQRR